MRLKALCDENIPGAVIASLKEWNFDVVSVIPQTPDPDIAAQAKREGRVIITLDSDFANTLVYPPREFPGIIRVRIDPPFINIIIPALKNVFAIFTTQEALEGELIIVGPTGFRRWEGEGAKERVEPDDTSPAGA